MKIDKIRVSELLRERGQHIRADWVDRELPDHIDVELHAGILDLLGLSPADLGAARP